MAYLWINYIDLNPSCTLHDIVNVIMVIFWYVPAMGRSNVDVVEQFI